MSAELQLTLLVALFKICESGTRSRGAPAWSMMRYDTFLPVHSRCQCLLRISRFGRVRRRVSGLAQILAGRVRLKVTLAVLLLLDLKVWSPVGGEFPYSPWEMAAPKPVLPPGARGRSRGDHPAPPNRMRGATVGRAPRRVSGLLTGCVAKVALAVLLLADFKVFRTPRCRLSDGLRCFSDHSHYHRERRLRLAHALQYFSRVDFKV